jgi:hypothetical protein
MVKQISVFLENKPGMLDKATKILQKANIDIRALALAETADFGLLRLIVDNPDAAVKTMNGGGLSAIIHEVLAVELDDRPGGLSAVTGALAKDNVNIEYMYAFVSRKADKAYVVLRPSDLAAAKKSLEKNRIKLATDKDIQDI